MIEADLWVILTVWAVIAFGVTVVVIAVVQLGEWYERRRP